MKIEELYKRFLDYPLISTDTRNIKANSIFFALKGANFDGNEFAEDALKHGAEYAVVDNPPVAKNKKIILVDDALATLQNLASFHREKMGVPVIAVTGTNGKTTTKELVSAVLSKKYETISTKGNLNNHIGVPLTLLGINKNTGIAVVEMGANHPGEIKALCQIAGPDFGLITNIGKAHLEGFGSFEGVKQTKAELYRFIEAKNGKIFINADNPVLDSLAGDKIEKICYGASGNVFLKGEIIGQSPFLNIRAWFPKGVLYLNSNLIGNYNFENILAAACVGQYFGVDPLKIQEAIKEYFPGNNRSQLIKKGTNTIIMDAYNANPSSMQASIKNFFTIPGENKYLILGDMLELGKSSAEEHQNIIELLSSLDLKNVFLIGKNFASANFSEPVLSFETTGSCISYLQKNPIKNGLILIKGSRGMQLEKVLEIL
jgi:UDP-N-acetylmuramoyl-tripeptide--D-alanyl-D-alanine ligase